MLLGAVWIITILGSASATGSLHVGADVSCACQNGCSAGSASGQGRPNAHKESRPSCSSPTSEEIGIAVSDGKDAGAVDDGAIPPPAQVTEVIALDLAPRQRVLVGESKGGKEAGAGEVQAVDRRRGPRHHPKTSGGCPARRGGPLPEAAAAVTVARREGSIDQPVEMHREGDGGRRADVAVAVPAAAERERLEFAQIPLGDGAVEVDADPLEAEIDHHPEEFPIVVGKSVRPRLEEIGRDIAPGARFVERFPQMFGHKAQRKADRRELDHALVAIADLSPIFGMVRIGAVREAARVES